MTTTVILNDEQEQRVLDQALQQKQAIINVAQDGAVSGNQFVFFAAFDGTNNDRNDVITNNRGQTPISLVRGSRVAID